jgi:small redox-active disulfide protein 2
MEIIILGTGCTKCKNLEEATRQAVKELEIDAVVSKEEDIVNIMNYGIMQTPGLVINGKVVLQGKLPTNPQLKELISSNYQGTK